LINCFQGHVEELLKKFHTPKKHMDENHERTKESLENIDNEADT
jgi:hypothetical protein